MAQQQTTITSQEAYTLILYAPFNSVLQLCQANRQIAAVCTSEQLWREKLAIDFPGRVKPPHLTYRQFYQDTVYSIIGRPNPPPPTPIPSRTGGPF